MIEPRLFSSIAENPLGLSWSLHLASYNQDHCESSPGTGCPFSALLWPCSDTHCHPIALFLHVVPIASCFIILFWDSQKEHSHKSISGQCKIYWSKHLNNLYRKQLIGIGVPSLFELPPHSLLSWPIPFSHSIIKILFLMWIWKPVWSRLPYYSHISKAFFFLHKNQPSLSN